MNSVEQKSKRRDRKIAHNESERQVWGDVRVSTWAIVAMAVLVLLGWFWMRH